MTIAVLQSRVRLRLHQLDVFASTIGGARVTEPAGDLATAIAIASAWKEREVPTDLVVCIAEPLRMLVGARQQQ